MKKLLVLSLSIAGLMLSASNAFAADKEVTISGEGQCAKCSLKKADACQNVIVAKEEGKEVVYWLAKNKVANDFHGKNLCQGTKKVKAVGTVKEVEGKKEFTISKIELDH
jgi:hypothetical protein